MVERYLVGGEESASSKGWTTVGKTTSTHFDMGDLEPFHEYDFRVKAVNAVGESDCIQVSSRNALVLTHLCDPYINDIKE